MTYAGLSQIPIAMWISLTRSKKLEIEAQSQKKEELLLLKD